MTRADDLASQLEIRDLTARFSDAVNRGAPDDLAALFTEDGVWQVPGLPPLVGRDAIRDMLAGVLRAFTGLIQHTHSGHVDVDGDRARATWYISELTRDGEGSGSSVAGVYTDELVLGAAGWRFARRTCDFLYQGQAELTGTWTRHPRAAGMDDAGRTAGTVSGPPPRG